MLYDLFTPQVYIISDKMYNDYKQKQVEAEVAEVDRRIKHYEDRLMHLKERREALVA